MVRLIGDAAFRFAVEEELLQETVHCRPVGESRCDASLSIELVVRAALQQWLALNSLREFKLLQACKEGCNSRRHYMVPVDVSL